ncbi:hypothetical protein GF376_00860 [Candidatus Peregrinibacteria bacterium]|nr:hypothetical protein [Candidatus Peregrinibacteria bacterium]
MLKRDFFRPESSKLTQKRLIFLEQAARISFIDQYETGKLDIEIQREAHERSKKLQDEIKAFEEAGRTKEEIEKKLLEDAEFVTMENIDRVLIDVNLESNGKPVKISDLLTDSKTKLVAKELIEKSKSEYQKQIKQALSEYYKVKERTKKDTKEAISKAAKIEKSRTYEEKPPAQLKKLEERILKGQKVKEEAKEELSGLKEEIKFDWRAVKHTLDLKTHPDSDENPIKDYEDSIYPNALRFDGKKITNAENPARHQLNGYLYAEYVYGGRGDQGKIRAENAYKKAVALYESSWSDPLNITGYATGGLIHRFDLSHVEAGLELGNDKEVEHLSEFDTVRGMMKGFLKLTRNELLMTEEQRDQYERSYLMPIFQQLITEGYQGNEQKQLELLFHVKSPFEYYGLEERWEETMAHIERITDQNGGLKDKKGKKHTIDNYQGMLDGKENPVKKDLESYLYGYYIFHGKGRGGKLAMEDKFIQIAKDYEESGMVWSTYEQHDIDDDLGVGKFYPKADKYTKFRAPKLIMATLYQQVYASENKGLFNNKFQTKPDIPEEKGIVDQVWEQSPIKWGYDKIRGADIGSVVGKTVEAATKQAETLNPGSREHYIKYLESEFEKAGNLDTEDQQMQYLTKIKSPKEYLKIEYAETEIGTVNDLKRIVGQNKYFEFGFNKDHQEIKNFIDGKNNIPAELVKEQAFFEVVLYASQEKAIMAPEMINKIAIIEQKNSELSKPLIPSKEIQSYYDRQRVITKKLNEAHGKIAASGNLTNLASSGAFKEFETAQTAYQQLISDLDYALNDFNDPSSERTTPPGEVPPVATAESGIESDESQSKSDESLDPYKDNWEKSEKIQSIFGKFIGTMTVTTGSHQLARLRDNNGNIVEDPLLNGTIVTRTKANSETPAIEVANKVFLKVTHNGKEYWIAEEYLEIKESGATTELTEEKPKSKPKIDPRPYEGRIMPTGAPTPSLEAELHLSEGEFPSFYDRIFAKVEEDLSASPYKTTIEIPFNNRDLSINIEKANDKYYLTYFGLDVTSKKLAFSKLSSLRNYVESNTLSRRITEEQIKTKSLWEKYASSSVDMYKIGNIKKFEEVKGGVRVKLDWKGRNAEVLVKIRKDGALRFLIKRNKVETDGEKYRRGYVSNFNQLMQEITSVRDWAENYRSYKKNPDTLKHEQLVRIIFNRQNYLNKKERIGHFYDFDESRIKSQARMKLKWVQTGSIIERNRQKGNPVLDVRINRGNQIEYKIYTQGPNSKGTFGTVSTYEEMISDIEKYKSNPSHYFDVNYRDLPGW